MASQYRPWIRAFAGIHARVNYKKVHNYHLYGGRGIKMLMTRDDLKYLWFKDKAYEMKRPSIDRIDPDGHYSIENCQYLELSENIAKKRSLRCENHPNAKLTNKNVIKIRKQYKSGKFTALQLGKLYGVDASVISKIIRNVIWTKVEEIEGVAKK